MTEWDDDLTRDEFHRESIARKAHRGAMLRHPDCSDPNHPGCEGCREEDMSYNTKIGHNCCCEVCGRDMDAELAALSAVAKAASNVVAALDSPRTIYPVADAALGVLHKALADLEEQRK